MDPQLLRHKFLPGTYQIRPGTLATRRKDGSRHESRIHAFRSWEPGLSRDAVGYLHLLFFFNLNVILI